MEENGKDPIRTQTLYTSQMYVWHRLRAVLLAWAALYSSAHFVLLPGETVDRENALREESTMGVNTKCDEKNETMATDYSQFLLLPTFFFKPVHNGKDEIPVWQNIFPARCFLPHFLFGLAR